MFVLQQLTAAEPCEFIFVLLRLIIRHQVMIMVLMMMMMRSNQEEENDRLSKKIEAHREEGEY